MFIGVLICFSMVLYKKILVPTHYLPDVMYTQTGLDFHFDGDLQRMVEHPEDYTLQEALAMIVVIKKWLLRVMEEHLDLDAANMAYFKSIMQLSDRLMNETIPQLEQK